MDKPRALSPAAAIDATAVALLLVAALIGLWPAFGGPGFLRPVIIGLVAGAGVAWLGAWRRWTTIAVAAATVGAYFLTGAAAALWTHAVFGVLPDLTTLKTLAQGSVGVWQQFVTASVPLGSFYGFMLVPFILALLASVTAFSAAWRARYPGLTLIPVAALTVLVILLGSSAPFYPTVQGTAMAVIAVAWLVWRGLTSGVTRPTGESAASVWRSRLTKAAILLGAGAVAAALVGPVLSDGSAREVLRRHVIPPLDTQAYASPLISFRDLVDKKKDQTLFTVTGWDKDLLLRLAVMDSYDGMVYNVGPATGGSRYDRVGADLGGAGEAVLRTYPKARPATVTITVDNYTGVWVPSVTHLTGLAFSGERSDDLTQALYYNPASDSLIDPAGLGSGVTYTVSAVVDNTQPTSETPISAVTMPQPAWVPDPVSGLAAQWASTDASGLTRVKSIVDTLQTTGYFSHGLDTEEPSTPGHSSYRIAKLLNKPERMIGDDEQYAVAAALLLNETGIPARVVMGFRATADSQFDGATWTVTGSDAHAWVEVPFDGIGWVAFFPTPDENQEPQQQDQRSRAKPKPQVLQPPPPANSAEDPSVQGDSDPRPDEDKKDETTPVDWAGIIRLVAVVSIPPILVLAPVVTIIALKAARRRRRQRVADPVRRVAFGWQEVLDRAADLGTVIPKAATRREAGRILASVLGAEGAEALARTADYSTFAPDAPTPAETDAFWGDATKLSGSLGSAVSWWRRVRSRVALTSLRRQPPPTVDLQEFI